MVEVDRGVLSEDMVMHLKEWSAVLRLMGPDEKKVAVGPYDRNDRSGLCMGLEAHGEGRVDTMQERLATSGEICLRPKALSPIAQLPSCR